MAVETPNGKSFIDPQTLMRIRNLELRARVLREFGARRLEANLYKLVNVLRVEDVSNEPTVVRDLALIKVSANGATRAEVMQLCEVFRARVVDVGNESLIIEITGTEGSLFLDDSQRDNWLSTVSDGIRFPMSTMPGEQVDQVFAGQMGPETIHFLE